jgi:UDP-N-acetylglucosamine 2-epimerase (non-hydrolysing)
MSGRSLSAVVPSGPVRFGPPDAHRRTTVLHAVADDDDVAAVEPVVAALARRPAFRQVLIHAGADSEPSRVAAGVVHRRLAIARGTDLERMAAALVAFEAVLADERPDLVVVIGDDDPIVAAAMAAAKQGIAVARLGAGRRSFDWTCSDEVNRTVIDRLSDTLLTTCERASANLRDEGVPDGRIHAVGNTRVDVVRARESRARATAAWRAHGVPEHGYTLVALRRPESVGSPERAERLAAALGQLTRIAGVILLGHPRTRAMLETGSAQAALAEAGVRSAEPRGPLHALSLLAGAGAIVTDAVPVAEEASALGVRCYSLLRTTPSTVTLTHGTNVLLGDDPSALGFVRPTGCAPTPALIPLWDGRAGERVADALTANHTLSLAHAAQR